MMHLMLPISKESLLCTRSCSLPAGLHSNKSDEVRSNAHKSILFILTVDQIAMCIMRGVTVENSH